MKYWKESQDEVRKVGSDREMARSLLKMIEIRMKALESLDRKEFSSLVVEGYYEIIKEAITALMAIDGYKTLSHDPGFQALTLTFHLTLRALMDYFKGHEKNLSLRMMK